MSKLKTLEDLLHHQIKDLYSAETQLIEALPQMAEETSNTDLKKAIQNHLEETKNQKKRLEDVGRTLGIEIQGETCKAMKGLINEAKDLIHEDASDEVRDAGIIADAQRVEHYEISAYGSAIAFAKELGKNEVVDKLLETLDEEKNADQELNRIAKSRVNEKAKAEA